MEQRLILDDFVATERLLHKDQFQGKPVLSLLGKSLAAWLVDFLQSMGVTQQPVIQGQVHPQAIIEGPVFIAAGAVVGPCAYIQGPCYIGPDAEVRHGAFIRGDVYVGARAVVGHTTEVKGSLFLDDAKAGHFAYVGDSILGREVNLGAGTKLANLKLRGNEVMLKHPVSGVMLPTGLRKFGALIADAAQTGCNSVLSPGTILMQKTMVLPCVHFHGTLTRGVAKS